MAPQTRQWLALAIFLMAVADSAYLYRVTRSSESVSMTSDAGPSSKTASTTLTLTPSRIDLGELEEGTERVFEVALSNSGKHTLEVERTVSSCGCTLPQLEGKTLGPAESSTLHITFRSATKQGRVSETVTLYSNAEGSPHKVVLDGYIKPLLVVTPERVELKSFSETSVKTEVTVSTTRAGLPLALAPVSETLPPGVTVEQLERTSDGSYRFVVQVDVVKFSGKSSLGAAEFHTGLPGLPMISIPVVAQWGPRG